ncbi:hypothetical protein HAV38_09510 [Glaciimonas immobilis]|nr:hypothetical protein HAV38_09510 [Glaciimonas immobilis]
MSSSNTGGNQDKGQSGSTRGGTHEQHVKAGEQSHKNTSQQSGDQGNKGGSGGGSEKSSQGGQGGSKEGSGSGRSKG